GQLEVALEQLRNSLAIPGLSAVIADHGRIIWEHGFGLADLERGVRVDPELTVFHLASLGKPYAAAGVLQLMDEQRLDLAAPISLFGVGSPGTDTVRIWHLLSHTASGKPGTVFRYDGAAKSRRCSSMSCRTTAAAYG